MYLIACSSVNQQSFFYFRHNYLFCFIVCKFESLKHMPVFLTVRQFFALTHVNNTTSRYKHLKPLASVSSNFSKNIVTCGFKVI